MSSISESSTTLLNRLDEVIPRDLLAALGGFDVGGAMKQLRRLAQSAHLNGDKESQGWVLLRISQALIARQNIENGLRLLREAHHLFDAIRSRFGMACVVLEEARALHLINRNALALEKAHRAVLALQKMGQPLDLARAYTTMAAIHARRLERTESLIFSKKAHAIFLEFRAPNSLAWNRCVVANVYGEMGMLPLAFDTFHEAMQRFQVLDNKAGLAWVNLQMAALHRRRCAFDAAEKALNLAQEYYAAAGQAERLALCWLELAQIRRATADTEDATLLCRRALKIFLRFRNTDGIACAMLLYGQVCHDRGQLTRAREQIIEAARLFGDIDNKIGLMLCDNTLAEIEIDRGNLPAAERMLLQAKSVASRWDAISMRAVTELNFARLALEQGRLQLAAMTLDQAELLAQRQEARDVQAEIALIRARYWLLLQDVTHLRESVHSAESFISAFRLERFCARARILRGELLVMEGKSAEARVVFEDTARRCKVWRQRRHRAEALLGALQISRESRTVQELLLALSYIKRDAKATEAVALQMLCAAANQLFRGAPTRTTISAWDNSPLFLARKTMVDAVIEAFRLLAPLRDQLLQDGPADLHLLRPRDPMGALPICVVS